MYHSFANRSTRLGSLAVLASFFSFGLYAQTTLCTPSSTAVLAHQEGVAEARWQSGFADSFCRSGGR
jgi:hypothetical protein